MNKLVPCHDSIFPQLGSEAVAYGKLSPGSEISIVKEKCFENLGQEVP